MKLPLNGILKNTASVSIGYGIVCGLIFPLMVSSTFLSEMNLSHNAGGFFGALFFASYAVSMLCLAFFVRSKDDAVKKRIILAGYFAAFFGNALMLAASIGLIKNEWVYIVSISILLGYGLSALELGWIARIAFFGNDDRAFPLFVSSRTIALSYIVGGIMTALIFVLLDRAELCFALVAIVASAAFFFRSELPAPPSHRKKKERGERKQEDRLGFIKAILYLSVFSFVFGAVSQTAWKDVLSSSFMEVQAVFSIVAASCLMLVVVAVNAKAVSITRFYTILFPVVAFALVVLPFFSTPFARAIAVVLVFIAYYLSGMNVRSVICGRFESSVWLFSGIALGLGGLFVLAGVAFGAFVLSGDGTSLGFASVSLVLLFVLSLSSLFSQRLDMRLSGKAAASNTDNRMQPVRAWALECGMAERETEVAIMVGQGRTRAYIAESLGISPNTVKGYIHNVYQKAGVAGKQELIDRIELLETPDKLP